MLVAGFGYLLSRRFSLHIGTLSSVVFNVLSPCLVFSSLVNSKLPGSELLGLVGFTVINIHAMRVCFGAPVEIGTQRFSDVFDSRHVC